MSCKNPPKIGFHSPISCVYRICKTLIPIRVLLGLVEVGTGLQEDPQAPLQATGSKEVICPPDPLLPPARPPRDPRTLCPWTCLPPRASIHPPQVAALCPLLLEALGCIWTRSSSTTSLLVSCKRWTPARERWVKNHGSHHVLVWMLQTRLCERAFLLESYISVKIRDAPIAVFAMDPDCIILNIKTNLILIYVLWFMHYYSCMLYKGLCSSLKWSTAKTQN